MTPHARTVRGLFALPTLAGVALGMLGAPWGVTAPAMAAAAPEPSPVPKRWQLDVECSPLRWTTVNTAQGPRAYYFMTYKVTNNSPVDLLFAPVFELATSNQNIFRSGRDVPVAVTNELLQRLENPFLEDQISIVATLLRGEENAKEGLVIWPVPADHLHEVSVYLAGFSGETATIEVPKVASPAAMASRTGEIPAAPAAETEKKVLRKTLMLRYRMPGDLNPHLGGEFQPYESRWIMR